MVKLIKNRVPMPELSVEERTKTFNEVPLGYSEGQAINEAKRCLQCKDNPCTKNCPVNVDVNGFIEELAEGNFKEAFLKIKQDNPIPAIAGRVCPQENQCEGACTMGKAGDSINIGKLEAFLGDWARRNGVREEFAIERERTKSGCNWFRTNCY